MSAIREERHDRDGDPWERLAEHQDTLEMLVERDTAMKERAERLLERLEEEGYR